MGIFGQVIVQGCPMLYLKIHAKNTFQTLQYHKTQKVDKKIFKWNSPKIPPLGQMENFWIDFGQK